MIIYLVLLSLIESSDLPEILTGRHNFCSVLLRMGFTLTLHVTIQAVSSYLAISPLLTLGKRYFLCCTFLRVASTRRYLAFCPMKPGLSSLASFRILQPRSSVLLNKIYFNTNRNFGKEILNIKIATTNKFP